MPRRRLNRRSFLAMVTRGSGGALLLTALPAEAGQENRPPDGKPRYTFAAESDPYDPVGYRCDRDATRESRRRRRRYSGYVDPDRRPTYVSDTDTGRRADPVNCGRRRRSR